MSRSLKYSLRRARSGATSALRKAIVLDRTGSLRKVVQGPVGGVLAPMRRKKVLAFADESNGDRIGAIRHLISAFPDAQTQNDPRNALYRITRNIARLEFQIRCQLELDPETLEEMGLAPLAAEDVDAAKAFVETFWEHDIAGFGAEETEALGRAYRARALKFKNNGKSDLSVQVLEPMITQAPEEQDVQRAAYEIALARAIQGEELDQSVTAAWWSWYETHAAEMPKKTKGMIRRETVKASKFLAKQERYQEAESLILPTARYWPEEHEALTVLARGAHANENWDKAAEYWQLYAAIVNPVTTKSRTHVAKNAAKRRRRTRYALNSLRKTRIKQATRLLADGKPRAFSETVSRIVESLPDHRVFKSDREIIDVVRLYVQQALDSDGVRVEMRPLEDGKPLRIAFCMDILKISDVHVHSRLIFRICRNLLEWNDQIETHIIVTNERFTVTTPVVNMSFSPTKLAGLYEAIEGALPEYYGNRCKLHYFNGIGLEGLVDTCKSVLDINPDVILFAGGHKGLFSNESRVVRHCLYDSVPAAFFFMQSNNEVDEKLDLIVARGPHLIEGDPGNAKTRIQPYPTLIDDSGTSGVVVDREKAARKTIVSAISGVRMDVRMNEMPREDLTAMLSILDDVPGSVWHLIGSANPKGLIRKNPEIARRVEAGQMVVHSVMAYEEFIDFVSNASLFFHPPGFTGGSGGSSVARKAGVPIITFKHSDVSGRQPPETVFDDENFLESLAFAKALLTDEDLWEKTVRAQVAHTTWIRETSIEGFYDCLRETVSIGRNRMAQAELTTATRADTLVEQSA